MEDKLLVQNFLSGNMDAFSAIYDKYSTELYRSAYFFCRNRHDAEDVLQETFITLYRQCTKIKKPESLKYWLFKVMTRESYKRIEQASKEIPDEEQIIGNKIYSDVSFTDHPLYEAVSELPPIYRNVIILYYYNGFSVKEIAQISDCFEGTVKSRLYKARKILKNTLLSSDEHLTEITELQGGLQQ